MNKITKNNTKKVIIILVIMMVCNFIVPKFSFAYEINGGLFFKPIAQFIARIADLVIETLQSAYTINPQIRMSIYTDDSEYIDEDWHYSTYFIKYSPGIIFSGKIPGLDINFISPIDENDLFNKFIYGEDTNFERAVEQAVPRVLNELGYLYVSQDIENVINEICEKVRYYDGTDGRDGDWSQYTIDNVVYELKVNCIAGNLRVDFYRASESGEWEEYRNINFGFILENISLLEEQERTEKINEAKASFRRDLLDYFGRINNQNYDELASNSLQGMELKELLLSKEDEIISPEREEIETYINYMNYNNEEQQIYIGFNENVQKYSIYSNLETFVIMHSIARQLQGIVVTWYNVLKVFSLVGLLVVLVYVAIRMIVSSTSKDKSKYKKMIIDWFIGICILFILQYIIGITLTVTTSISDFFSSNVVGSYGEDVLMTKIRNLIGDIPASFEEIFAEVVMYVVLVVYTVLFTIQYMKRVIYMAFLIIISPLVAFTYPLDKLKDGKAQAFSSWLKEFIYTALVQPVHLIIYVLLVNSAIDTVKEIPIYAIIIIGFLLPAEKFVKKMFGLDKSNTVGNMATALGGAALMNTIRNLGGNAKKGSKGGKSEGKVSNNEGDGKSQVRTVDSNTEEPYSALRDAQKTIRESQASSNVGGATSRNSGRVQDLETENEEENQNGNRQETPRRVRQEQTRRNIKNGSRVRKGAWSVAKKYVFNKNTGMSVARGVGKVTGVALLGTLGLAAGIATGEEKNVIAGLTVGIAAGSRVGGNLVDRGANLVQEASEGINGIRDAYGEGAYGEEEYARMKFDREFKKSQDYKDLIEKYPGRENDFQEFLNSGITDTRKMAKAMEKNYNVKEAIAYAKMAETKECPEEVLYSNEKFKTFLTSRKLVQDLTEQIEKIKKQDENIQKEKEIMNGRISQDILEDEEKFRDYLVKNRIIEDLEQERRMVNLQTQQINQIRRGIVDFK